MRPEIAKAETLSTANAHSADIYGTSEQNIMREQVLKDRYLIGKEHGVREAKSKYGKIQERAEDVGVKYGSSSYSVRTRLPWLTVLFFLGLLVSSVIGVFESLVSQLTLIVCFQSLVLGMAGNAGTQSLALTIRLIAENGIDKRKNRKLIFKELRTGFFTGIFLGILSFISIGAYVYFLKNESAAYAFSVSGCVATALAVSVSISSLVGTATPIILYRCGIDPALASGPLITTANDLVAVVTYYGLAAWLLVR